MTRTTARREWLLLAVCLALAGCEDGGGPGGATPNADAGRMHAANRGGGDDAERDSGNLPSPAADASADSEAIGSNDSGSDSQVPNDAATQADASGDDGGDAGRDGASPGPDAGGGCASNADCPDLGPCAASVCVGGECQATSHDGCPIGSYCGTDGSCVEGADCDEDADCTDTDACSVGGRCFAAVGRCEYRRPDLDGDGQTPIACGGLDCNDDPGADGARMAHGLRERCDGLDNDCDGLVDELDGPDDRLCRWSYECAGAGTPSAVCACPAGTEECDDRCVDTQTDANNCGGCAPPVSSAGERCGSGAVCADGACLCQGGVECTEAADECIDFDRDVEHCGACNGDCPLEDERTGALCLAGECTPCGRPGEPCCTSEEPCEAGQCSGVPGEVGATCEACGGHDEPCCTGPGSRCRSLSAFCRADRCVACGLAGEPCCPVPLGAECGRQLIFGDPDLRCTGVPRATGAVCAECGAVGEACCRHETLVGGGDPTYTCDDDSSECFDDECVACGAPGQACCQSEFGRWCRGDSTCSATTGECSE